jgi:inosine/xanthosine triphosphate pyrophosphatase family protein
MRLVAATRNPAKVAELARLVTGLAEVVSLPPDAGPDAPEEGDRLEAIAAAKARHWSRLLDRGELVVASDGGLLIPALGPRWDPARTRRFAGSAATDAERAEALLALTADLAGDRRRIGWREALAVARDGVLLACWAAEGEPGLLARDYDPRAIATGAGFWVPALWICPGRDGRRLAELPAVERDAVASHWSVLGARLRAFLEEWSEPVRPEVQKGAGKEQ